VRGLHELFAERGLQRCLGFCSEPEVARRQADLFRETAAHGCWQALHFQVRGYRPPGATEDCDWQRPLTWYDYDEQREVLTIARALGWVARPLSRGVRDSAFPRGHNVGNVGHSVPEIWSNQYRKWVLLDPDLNLHYERDGVPLSALEMHEAWLAHEAEAVTVVQEEPPFTLPVGEHVELVSKLTPNMDHFSEQEAAHLCRRFVRHRALDYYARLTVGRWTWLDRRCLPAFVSHFAPGGTGVLTDNPDDLYWTVNMVRLSAQAAWADGPNLTVSLKHCMPWFNHFETRVDGGVWQTRPATLDWPLREGENVLEVRPVNVCGRPGLTSRLEVAYAPAKW